MPEIKPMLAYVAQHAIIHDQQTYQPGDRFQTADEATIAHLRARGAIKLPEELRSPAQTAERAALLAEENAALKARLAELTAAADRKGDADDDADADQKPAAKPAAKASDKPSGSK